MKNIKKFKYFTSVNEGNLDSNAERINKNGFDWEVYDSANPEYFFIGKKDKEFVLRYFNTNDPNDLLMIHAYEDSREENYVIKNTNGQGTVVREGGEIYNFYAKVNSSGDKFLFLKVTADVGVYNTEYKVYTRK